MFTSSWMHHLWDASISATVLIALLLLARRFVRTRVGGGAVYAAWLLVALRLLIPLSLPNPLLTKAQPAQDAYRPVSYTHLDVYKRQGHHREGDRRRVSLPKKGPNERAGVERLPAFLGNTVSIC